MTVPKQVTQEAHALPALRILVIDDNRDAADSLAVMLRMFGYEAQAGYDASALNMAEDFQPHVFIIDLAMPGVSGLMLANSLAVHPRHHKALRIAVTGFSHNFPERSAVESGFDHFLVKPIDSVHLQRVLEDWAKGVASC
jgi:CheY-like chemotaxis protein